MSIYKFDGKYYEGYIDEVRKILNDCNNHTSDNYLNSTDGLILYNKENPDDTSTLVGDFIYDLKTCYAPIREKYDKLNNSITNINRYGKHYRDQLDNKFQYFQNISDDLKTYKENFLVDVNYYIKVAKACGEILVLVYFSILCGISTFGCILLILYTIFEKQGLMNLLMHIVWNTVRFFVFSFFIYGAAFGMLYLGLRDAIAYNMFLFGEGNLNSSKTYLLPQNDSKEFLKFCLLDEKSDYTNLFDKLLINNLDDLFENYGQLKKSMNEECIVDEKFNRTYEYAGKKSVNKGKNSNGKNLINFRNNIKLILLKKLKIQIIKIWISMH
jgi:hypothetical protein